MRHLAVSIVGIVLSVLSMHPATVLPNCFQFGHVEHLTELPEVVFFRLDATRRACLWLYQLLQRLEIRAVLGKPANIYLCPNEIADFAPTVTKWGYH